MTKYKVHFYNAIFTYVIHAPNIDIALDRANEKYDNVSHVEEV